MIFPTEVARGWRLRSTLLCLAALSTVSACGGGAASMVVPRARSAAKLPHHVFETIERGMRIVSLPRATPGVLWLALYIDAGSRDALLPETATLSARLAAERAGAAVEATVFPDVTELSMPCQADALRQCVAQLAAALGARDPDEAALSAARARLRADQRRALDAEPDSALDVAAIDALLGQAGHSFFPLGSVNSDLVAASQAVAGFMSDHFGPARSLLVAAGEIGPEQLREVAGQAFAAAPSAVLSRVPRVLAPLERPKLSVSFEDFADKDKDKHKSGAALALAGKDEATLRDVTQKLAALLSHAEPKVAVKGYVFAARSGALGLVHLRGHDAERMLREASRELARMQREPATARPAALRPDDLRSSARELGFAFGGEGGVSPRALSFGAALALPAEPDAGPADVKARTDREQKRRERAQSAFAETLAQADPKLSGDSDRYVAAVQLKSGTHLDVQFIESSAVAVSIRVASGAASDPPSLHGRAALLATLTSMYCAGMGPELLRARFAQLGAAFEMRVDAESYGMLLRVPKDHFEEATELALRCMRAPSREPNHVVEAAVRLQQRLRASDRDLLYRARTAAAISPKLPGPLAPWGDPSRVPNLQQRELEQALHENQAGERWAIAVVGPVEVQRSTAWLARRMSDLAAEPRTAAAHWDEPASTLPGEAPRSRGQQGSFIALWTAHGEYPYPGALGAELFARSLRALLGALPGVEVLWHEADSYKQTSFAALALRVRQDLLRTAPSWLADAAHSLDDVWIERALEPAVAEAERQRSAAQAELAVRAEQTARLRLGASFDPATLDTARKQVQGLRASAVGIVEAPP